jgi:tRNA (guanine6-N2)-methyltransferase
MRATEEKMSHKPIDVFARTIRGIEWIAAAEIEKRCDATITEIRHREIRFQVQTLGTGLLDLGSVDDVFLTCSVMEGLDHTRSTLSLLARFANTVNFAKLIEPLTRIRSIPHSPNFDVIASFLGRRNYNRFEVEDTIAVIIQEQTGWRYAQQRGQRSSHLDLSFRIHLSGKEAVIGARLTRTPLHRRTYKIGSRIGTLHPPLAFAMAMVSNLGQQLTVLDPFCGVGTIPIEALRLQSGIRVLGVDIDSDSICKAINNGRAANLDIEFLVGDAGQLPFMNGAINRIISNPPWGRTVGLGGNLRGGTLPFIEEIKRVSTPDAQIVLLIDSVAEHQASMEHGGLKLLLRSPVSLFGSWPEICLLVNASSRHQPVFDEASFFGSTLDKYWRKWAKLWEKTSNQS